MPTIYRSSVVRGDQRAPSVVGGASSFALQFGSIAGTGIDPTAWEADDQVHLMPMPPVGFILMGDLFMFLPGPWDTGATLSFRIALLTAEGESLRSTNPISYGQTGSVPALDVIAPDSFPGSFDWRRSAGTQVRLGLTIITAATTPSVAPLVIQGKFHAGKAPIIGANDGGFDSESF